MAVRTYSSRAQHTCPSWTRCPVVTPVTFKEEARQNECLMLLRFQRKLLNRLFLPCCSPQTFPFLPKITSRELANPISPFFPPAQPTGGSSTMSSCSSPTGRWKLSGQKIHSSPESKKAILGLQNSSSRNCFLKPALSYSGIWLRRYKAALS